MWPFKKYMYRITYQIDISTGIYARYIEARSLEAAIKKLRKDEDPFQPRIIDWGKY